MRIKSMIILMAAAVLFASACALQDRVEPLATGKYVMKDAQTEEWAWVLLEEENRFEFNRNLATSYRPMGTYVVENDVLVLKVNDQETYKFKIKGDTLIFESGKYAESLIEKGTVFELSKKE